MCATCGVLFETTIRSKRHCSKRCESDELASGGQICWRCKNATGGCSWSKNLTPVKDWIAEPRIIRNYDNILRTYEEIHTYKIKYCPMFDQEFRAKSEIDRQIIKERRKQKRDMYLRLINEGK